MNVSIKYDEFIKSMCQLNIYTIIINATNMNVTNK